MEAGSAINAPHPDDVEDDAEDFFGGDGEDEATPETVIAGEDDDEGDGEVASPTGDVTPAAEAPAPEPDSAGGDSRGSAEREYIVFQKVPLTEKVLKHLLAAIEKGDAPKPRVAFFELHRAVTRNDRQAVAEAYKTNRGVLGESCDLAAVSSRSFKERHVEPRVRTPTDDIAIT